MAVSIPWQWKLHLKLAFSRAGLPYGFWSRLGLFRHGAMDQGEYALKVFQTHVSTVDLPPGFSALELGPGDSLASALIAKAHGARKIWLVDQGDYARKDVALYQRLAAFLRGFGLSVPDGWRTVGEMLEACGAAYLTRGLASLQTLPEASIDFMWSQAVLEHIWREEFSPTLLAMRRILSPTGFMTHQVDLKDHLGGALNNLRFPEETWESPAWRRGGFYTNRLRFRDILTLLEEANIQAEVRSKRCWQSLPTARERMVPPFRDLPEEDLLIQDFFILCKR